MATRLQATMRFPADAQTVFAMLSDEAYVALKGRRTGGREVRAEVRRPDDGSVVVVCDRVLPAKLPGYARSLVGDTIHVVETHTWSPADATGVRAGRFDVGLESIPVAIHGTLQLAGDGTETTDSVDAAVKASVPFIGGKLERIAEDLIRRYLAKEEEVGAGWLAGDHEQ